MKEKIHLKSGCSQSPVNPALADPGVRAGNENKNLSSPEHLALCFKLTAHCIGAVQIKLIMNKI